MLPAETEKLLDAFVGRSKEILKDGLVGVYLHGSAAMGCFNPEKSDIDLITVVSRPPSAPVKKAYMDMVVKSSALGPAKGIEMSVVTRDVCMPFVYPTPFELHFSVGHLERYRADPEAYIRDMRGTDKDLAAHFTVINARGRCLFGAPIKDVFAPVPRADYMDALWYDVSEAPGQIAEDTMYLTLNLARVLAFREEGRVLSKREGGEWALSRLPAAYIPLIRDALKEYTEGTHIAYDETLAADYAEYMLKRISG